MDRIDDPESDAMAAVARGINLGLLGTFIAALFMSVLYYPVFWLAFALTSALRNISKNKVKEIMNSSISVKKRSLSQQKELPQVENTAA